MCFVGGVPIIFGSLTFGSRLLSRYADEACRQFESPPSATCKLVKPVPTGTLFPPRAARRAFCLMIINEVELVEKDAVPLGRVAQHLRVVDHLVVDSMVRVVAVVALAVGRWG